MKLWSATRRPLFSQLLDGLEAMEEPAQLLNQINQIIAKLQRRKRSMTEELRQHFADMALPR